MSKNVLYRSVLYGKLYQGHPATIFCKITVRRRKSDCLEISKAWEKLACENIRFSSLFAAEEVLEISRQ